jgi:hypothetical protein
MFDDLTVHELTHFLLTLLTIVLTICVSFIDKKWKNEMYYLSIFIGSFLGEFLLDIDHLFDYVIAFGPRFNLEYFLNGTMFEKTNMIILPFHSWELIIIAAIGAWLVKNRSIRIMLISFMIGVFLHLAYDTVYNHIYIQGYSFIYRFIHNFDPHFISIGSS